MFLRIDGGALDGATVKVPEFSAIDYGRVCEFAMGGRVDEPLVDQFIAAFCTAIGLDPASLTWSDVEKSLLLQWLGLAPKDEWTALDDLELARVLGGAV